MRSYLMLALVVSILFLTVPAQAAPMFGGRHLNDYFAYELACKLDGLIPFNTQEAVKTDRGWVIMTSTATGLDVQVGGWTYVYHQRVPAVVKTKTDGSTASLRLNNYQTRRFLRELREALATRKDVACQTAVEPREIPNWEAELIHAPCYEGHCDQNPAPDDSYGYPPPPRRSILDRIPSWPRWP